ncbi:hydroxyacylglutathione hydrolase [Alteromonadaceae bacterium BrNp21-10]|nr:hydroxyacylglutathione hydrolase [Alteromonadaceae bacterium BrNp21-10]
MKITPINAFQDNYIWCIEQQTKCVVVDPGDASPVLAYLQQQQLTLSAILVTHHHPDHIDGIVELKNHFPDAKVYAADDQRIPAVDYIVTEGDKVVIDSPALTFSVLNIPGHTTDHIAYYGETGLFSGDTLFSVGCGRLLGGTAVQLYTSLQKLAALPGDTPVYCTHEYTLANIAFALEVDADNHVLASYADWAHTQRRKLKPTVPTSIRQELRINPFLRCHTASIKKAVEQYCQRKLSSRKDIFAELRRWKDQF